MCYKGFALWIAVEFHYLSIETSALQVLLSFSFLSLLQWKYLSANPGILFFLFGFVLLPFQNYWISPRFSLPFFSSFHYKLRLLIPLLTIVSKYSAGEKTVSLSVKNVQFYRSNKAQNFSLYCFCFEGKWTSVFFCKICNQCNKHLY